MNLWPVVCSLRAACAHRRMRSEKKDGVPLPLGGPGAMTHSYLIKASLLAGEPLRPNSDNTRRQVLGCKMLL